MWLGYVSSGIEAGQQHEMCPCAPQRKRTLSAEHEKPCARPALSSFSSPLCLSSRTCRHGPPCTRPALSPSLTLFTWRMLPRAPAKVLLSTSTNSARSASLFTTISKLSKARRTCSRSHCGRNPWRNVNVEYHLKQHADSIKKERIKKELNRVAFLSIRDGLEDFFYPTSAKISKNNHHILFFHFYPAKVSGFIHTCPQ